MTEDFSLPTAFMKWWDGMKVFFYDMSSHVTRLKRSLRELRINWPDADLFPSFALDSYKNLIISKTNRQWYISR